MSERSGDPAIDEVNAAVEHGVNPMEEQLYSLTNRLTKKMRTLWSRKEATDHTMTNACTEYI